MKELPSGAGSAPRRGSGGWTGTTPNPERAGAKAPRSSSPKKSRGSSYFFSLTLSPALAGGGRGVALVRVRGPVAGGNEVYELVVGRVRSPPNTARAIGRLSRRGLRDRIFAAVATTPLRTAADLRNFGGLAVQIERLIEDAKKPTSDAAWRLRY